MRAESGPLRSIVWSFILAFYQESSTVTYITQGERGNIFLIGPTSVGEGDELSCHTELFRTGKGTPST